MHAAITKIATELGVSPANIAKWRQRGKVAYNWRLPVLEAAQRQGILLTSADMVFTKSGDLVDKSSEGSAA